MHFRFEIFLHRTKLYSILFYTDLNYEHDIKQHIKYTKFYHLGMQ